MDNDAIFLLDPNGSLEKIPHKNYANEDILQGLIEKYPEILAGEQIDPDFPPRWLLIKREAGVPGAEAGGDRWAVDHLLLDQWGRPTFVEVKRSSDSRTRRDVVGQMLDYAANAVVYWPSDRIRSLAEELYGGVEGLNDTIRSFLEEDSDSPAGVESYWELVTQNLRTGNIRLLFVADIIPTELRRIIEFLNEHMPQVEVLGVEVRKYEGESVKALVPRVVGQTESARQQKKPAGKTTVDEFLSKCDDKVKQFFLELFDCAEAEGYTVLWGTKGFSLRIKVDEGKALSLFYGYPPGGHGAQHALFQAYTGYLNNPDIRNELKEKLSEFADFALKGQYTPEVLLTPDIADSLRPKLRDLLGEVKRIVEG